MFCGCPTIVKKRKMSATKRVQVKLLNAMESELL